MLSLNQILHIILPLLPLFFVFIFLILRNNQVRANKILVVFMLILSLQYTFSAFEILGYPNLAILGYYLLIPLMLCSPPILNFYIKYLTIENYKFNLKSLIHFVPAIAVLIINIITYSQVLYSDKILIITQQFNKEVTDMNLKIYLKTYEYAQIFYSI